MMSLQEQPLLSNKSAIELCSLKQPSADLVTSQRASEIKFYRTSAETLLRAVTRSAQTGLPNHTQLGNAIIQLINAGALTPGNQIQPHQLLSPSLGITLDTVQKTLNRLDIEL